MFCCCINGEGNVHVCDAIERVPCVWGTVHKLCYECIILFNSLCGVHYTCRYGERGTNRNIKKSNSKNQLHHQNGLTFNQIHCNFHTCHLSSSAIRSTAQAAVVAFGAWQTSSPLFEPSNSSLTLFVCVLFFFCFFFCLCYSSGRLFIRASHVFANRTQVANVCTRIIGHHL